MNRHTIATSAGKSKSSVSGGIDFRNTPDTLLVDARPISNKVFTGLGAKNMPNWRVLTMLDEQENLYEGSFSVLNTWQTVRLALLHDELVSCLNIVLNSGNSENAQDYGGDACYTSQVDFRNVRVAYSSNLKGIIYNGATISPFNAFIILQGVETLSLRVERHVENTKKVVP